MNYEIAQMEVAQNSVVKKQHFECFSISGMAVRISRRSTSHAFSALCNCLTVPPKSSHSTWPASGRTWIFQNSFISVVKLKHGNHSLKV